MIYLMNDLKKEEKSHHFDTKNWNLCRQNSDPALWQIADPYIGSAEFLSIGKIKSFSLLSLHRLTG